MAPHSSTLAWKIPRTEEPGGLQSMGSLGVRQDWATSLSLFTSCIGEGNGTPLQCSGLENPGDGGAWWAAVCGVAQSRTRLSGLAAAVLHPRWWVCLALEKTVRLSSKGGCACIPPWSWVCFLMVVYYQRTLCGQVFLMVVYYQCTLCGQVSVSVFTNY